MGRTTARATLKASHRLSADEARRLALRAQGFGGARPAHPIDVLDALGVIQLDSVNALARSQDLVPCARIGPTSVAAMHDAIYPRRRGFEYWGHAASWLPMDEYRYFLPRMAALATRFADAAEAQAPLTARVLERIRQEGALGAADFHDQRAPRASWWDRTPSKVVLEHLLATGNLMCAGRRAGFERLYDLPERVLPATVDTSDPGPAAAHRHLARRSIAALGVATAHDVADYFRLRLTDCRPALRDLVEADEIVEVDVEGWSDPAFALSGALAPPFAEPMHRATFLSPFDNLIWDRPRVERLFGFRYRIEIYVPEPRRQHGYYVLPLLARGQLVGRADLKHDRKASALRVVRLSLEGAAPDEAAAALRDLAVHLGATSISLEAVAPPARRGDVEALVS
ncbi:MAG: winged helix-turn-helix domain-containing protein [Chloroflexota bacterium]